MKRTTGNVSKARRTALSIGSFVSLAGISLTLFFATSTSASPSERRASDFCFLPAAKHGPFVPLPSQLRDSAKGMAGLLYKGVTGSTATASELTQNVNLAADELAKQLAPKVTINDGIYYDLFGDLGMFTHLVEQTTLLIALNHHKSISPSTLLTSLRSILGSSAGATLYNNVATLTGRPLLKNKSNSRQDPPKEPRYPHGPIDPNEMGGPIALLEKPQDVRPQALVSCLSPSPAAAFYTQPFIYTIRFANKVTATGPAKTITITDILDPANLDLSSLRLGEVTVENSPNGGMPILVQFTPSPAVISNGVSRNFPIASGNVVFTRTGKQLTWIIKCTLAPGSEGSVSFLVSPKNPHQPIAEDIIHNDGAEILFAGAGAKHTNPWLAVPTP